MGVEIYAGDLLSTNKLKNTDATSNLHNDQRNIEQSQISKADGPSGVGDLQQAQNSA